MHNFRAHDTRKKESKRTRNETRIFCPHARIWNTQNAQAAAALLEYGAKANLTVGDGLTPLHEAVGAGSIAVSEMLVRAGANVSVESFFDAKNATCFVKRLCVASRV